MDLLPNHLDFSSICNETTQETDNGNQPNDKRENKSEIHFKAYLFSCSNPVLQRPIATKIASPITIKV